MYSLIIATIVIEIACSSPAACAFRCDVDIMEAEVRMLQFLDRIQKMLQRAPSPGPCRCSDPKDESPCRRRTDPYRLAVNVCQ